MEVITTHINADFDCLGAMVAAKRLYPEAVMIFAGAQERSLRQFFVQSTLYAFDIRRVKEIDLEEVTRLILVDVRDSERIGPFAELALRDDVDVHIYDHHPEGASDLCGSLEVIEQVGSTVTVLSHIFMERNLEPTAEEATAMMLGLYEDTGSLTFSSTTENDFLAAAFLLRHGANLNTVSDFLVQELNAAQVSLLNDLIKTRIYLPVRGVEVCIAHASRERYVPDLAMLAHKLRDMEHLDVLIVAVRMDDRIFMVARSRLPEVHVGEILGEFGGGGHAFAASGTVRDMTLVELLERLPAVLERYVESVRDAAHLMSSPVKTLSVEETVGAAQAFLTRYQINAAPVLEDERLVGILTRQVAERAAHHGLAEVALSEYMQSDIQTVGPECGLDEVQDILVDGQQRLVPVVDDDGELIGVVTRTDLLRHIVRDRRHTLPYGGRAGEPNLRRKQITSLMRERLPQRVLDMFGEMGEVAREQGSKIYVVGGFVRDLLLRGTNFDIDIVVEGDGIAFAEHYAKRAGCRVRAHHKFGTAVLVFPDDFKVDVASTRREYYQAPGQLPTVEKASVRHDLYRRDFTINTLAIALTPPHFGQLLDFFGAQRDLRDGAVRVLHNLSFVEDPTRMFRAVRFEQRLGFRLGGQTEQLLKSAVRMGFLDKVGGPRLYNELVIMLREAKPVQAIRRMQQLDLLKCLHPELSLNERSIEVFEQADRAVSWHELLYLGSTCQRWLVYALCLLHGLADEAVADTCGRLQVPRRYRSILRDERSAARETLKGMHWRAGKEQPADSTIHSWLAPFSEEVLLYLMAATTREEVRRWISHFITSLRQVTVQLSGDDLIALGVPRGPRIREFLTELRRLTLDGQLRGRAEEQRWVEQALADHS
ncbi:MAG: polya polymerase [Desulfuromonas sp.]|nr:MAG: polya polymerase [Desulfuromonas sp.]